MNASRLISRNGATKGKFAALRPIRRARSLGAALINRKIAMKKKLLATFTTAAFAAALIVHSGESHAESAAADSIYTEDVAVGVDGEASIAATPVAAIAAAAGAAAGAFVVGFAIGFVKGLLKGGKEQQQTIEEVRLAGGEALLN